MPVVESEDYFAITTWNDESEFLCYVPLRLHVLIHSHVITWGLSQFVREGGGGPVNILGGA